jgi:peptidoglycan/LPS O-acetylase OafA/YrhL
MGGRLFGLDFARAVAILLVIVHHGFNVWSFPFIPLPDGVDIFFVLSGFLIGGILIRTVTQSDKFKLCDVKLFLCRRWLRTLPALWFVLAVNLVITFLIHYDTLSGKAALKKIFLEDRLWEYLVFIQNLTSNLRTSFFPESWSLSVEEWFYAIFPVLLFLLMSLGRDRQRAILAVVLVMIFVPCIIRYSLSDVHLKGTWMVTRMIVIMRLDSIAFGVLLAYLHRFNSRTWYWLQRSRFLFVSGFVLFYLSFLIIQRGGLYFNSITLTNWLFFPFSSICVMIFLPKLAVWSVRDGVFKDIVTFISKISYSMYLVNYSIVIQLIANDRWKNSFGEYRYLLYLLYWLFTIIISISMYRYIEQPFLKLRDRYFRD